MKNFLEKIINSLPYFILALLFGSLLILIFRQKLGYEQFIGIVQTLIWPAIVLIGLLFFRKVFTYLFLSMEEFNFFGTRGKLRDAREIIEEKVEKRITEERERKVREEEATEFATELKKAKDSKEDSDKKAEENLKIAKEIFGKYQDISKTNAEMTKELNEFRRRQEEKEARIAMIKSRISQKATSESQSESNIEITDVPKADKSTEPTK
jgi:hypothetical protein